MASSRKRHSDEEWLQHRATIQRMFLDESASFSEIMRKLEEDDFPVTKSQLEYKLKMWGLRRRIPKNKTEILWQFVDGRLSKREKQGKLSEVIYDGKVIAPAKVRKERRRYQTTSLVKYQQGPASPRTPQEFNISVCTPAPLHVQSSWPKSLPWLRFRADFPESFEACLKPGTGTSLSNIQTNFHMWRILELQQLSDNPNVSLLAKQLDSIMPEAKERENESLAHSLLKAQSQTTIPEYCKLLIYRISNNMEGFWNDFQLTQLSWILDVLNNSNMMNWKLTSGKTSCPTINAFVEKVFQNTLATMYRIYNDFEYSSELAKAKKVISWLLSLGQSPNTPIRESDGTYTPLELAVNMGDSELALEILDAGADPKIPYFGLRDVLSDFEHFFLLDDKDNLDPKMIEVFKRLVASGLSLNEEKDDVGPSALMEVVSHGTVCLVDILIQRGANVLYTSPDATGFFRKVSVLGFAATINEEKKALVIIDYLLKRAQSAYPHVPLADFIEIDVVLNAASNGHLAVLYFLYKIGYNVVVAESKGITALHMAAASGIHSVCRWLLNHGSLVDGPDLLNECPSPMIVAASRGHVDIVKLLHRHGADLNRTFDVNCNSRKCGHSQFGLFYRYLEYLGDFSINPAGAAILRDDWNNAEYRYLAQNGARLPEWAAYYGALSDSTLDLIKVVLKDKANVNWLSCDNKTTLHAVLSLSYKSHFMRGHTDDYKPRRVSLAFELLSAGAILMGGEVQLAMLLGDWSLVEEILRIGSHDIFQWKGAMSPLEMAFLSGSENMVQYVFKSNPEAYSGGALCAAIIFALEHNSTTWLQRLLKNRHQSESMSNLERTAVYLATWSAEKHVLRVVCGEFKAELGALFPLTRNDNSSYYRTSIDKYLSMWKSRERELPFWHDDHCLVTQPLSVILQSSRWESELQAIGHCGQTDAITLSINLKSEDILQLRLSAKQHDSLKSLRIAMREGNLEVVKALLDAGIDVNSSIYVGEWFGKSFLQQAVESQNLSMIDLLLRAGAEINAPAARKCGATALQLAAIKGRVGTAKMLIERGADVNAPRAEKGGGTALEGAAEHGRLDMVQLLLSEGADTGGRGRLQYMRAIRFAEQEGHVVASNMLRDYRDWTTADDDLWMKLKGFPRNWEEKLEDFFFGYGEQLEVEDRLKASGTL
ncbi:uncharacterized protein BDZ83DRAFT_611679 [Colletotrichum acutatum]|uniref:Clr5 domain-containing protein n=1 Tax=Glomerella acutata TaxID=27357 RepID=A0AAD8UV95_GLOAC|nr:uncharacterized protein BDZ83DRAFT_611679 [Colletotrichum acutatum]KAK1727674.1 hypothetical protein BDZ83DRAFT_611679 [Colletotrichum acutatum]